MRHGCIPTGARRASSLAPGRRCEGGDGRGEPTAPRWLARLPEVLACLLALVELPGELLGCPPPEGLLDELAGQAAFATAEPLGLYPGLALGADGDLDGLVHAAPPTW